MKQEGYKGNGRIVATYDPKKHEYFAYGIMYRIKRNGIYKEIWRVKR